MLCMFAGEALVYDLSVVFPVFIAFGSASVNSGRKEVVTQKGCVLE